MITTLSDYIYPYNISTNNSTESELLKVMQEQEPLLLKKILGVELAKLYLLDVAKDLVDREERFIVLDSEIVVTTRCGKEYFNSGVNKMLVKFIFAIYISQNSVKKTIAGNVKNNFENSTHVSNRLQIVEAYNSAVLDSKVIQTYICDDLDLYPEYKGSVIENANYF
jgi:hypothetical protein